MLYSKFIKVISLGVSFAFIMTSCSNEGKQYSEVRESSESETELEADSLVSAVNVSSGMVQRYRLFDAGFGDTLTVDVWTPDGYNADSKYAVLYMHDGQMLFDAETTWNKKAWEMDDTAGRLIAADSVRPFIIVGIHNLPTRLGDYLPHEITDLQLPGGETDIMKSMFQVKLRGGEYVTAIVKTIKPFIDSTYSTIPTADATAVAGSSMGGLISFYAIAAYPEVFGGAICMSTHFSTDANRPELADAIMKYVTTHLPDPATHKIYMDNGTKPCDDAYIPFFHNAVEVLKANGYDDSSLLWRDFPGDVHDEVCWARRVHIPLKFVFSK